MQRDRIVVTDRAGFLGGHLCEESLNGGANVFVPDDVRVGTPATFDHLTERGRAPMSPASTCPARSTSIDFGRGWRPHPFNRRTRGERKDTSRRSRIGEQCQGLCKRSKRRND